MGGLHICTSIKPSFRPKMLGFLLSGAYSAPTQTGVHLTIAPSSKPLQNSKRVQISGLAKQATRAFSSGIFSACAHGAEQLSVLCLCGFQLPRNFGRGLTGLHCIMARCFWWWCCGPCWWCYAWLRPVRTCPKSTLDNKQLSRAITKNRMKTYMIHMM